MIDLILCAIHTEEHLRRTSNGAQKLCTLNRKHGGAGAVYTRKTSTCTQKLVLMPCTIHVREYLRRTIIVPGTPENALRMLNISANTIDKDGPAQRCVRPEAV